MKIPIFLLSAGVGLGVMLEAWTLSEIVNLKVEVSAIKTQLTVNQHLANK